MHNQSTLRPWRTGATPGQTNTTPQMGASSAADRPSSTALRAIRYGVALPSGVGTREAREYRLSLAQLASSPGPPKRRHEPPAGGSERFPPGAIYPQGKRHTAPWPGSVGFQIAGPSSGRSHHRRPGRAGRSAQPSKPGKQPRDLEPAPAHHRAPHSGRQLFAVQLVNSHSPVT